MSATVRATGFRIARQFTLAVTLCAAVAGGAVATAMPVDNSVSRQVVAGSADNNWPAVPATTQDNNWPTTPTTPQDNNWPTTPTTPQDNNWPTTPTTPQDNNWPTTPQDNNWPSNSSAL